VGSAWLELDGGGVLAAAVLEEAGAPTSAVSGVGVA